jgi:hypothetical protein
MFPVKRTLHRNRRGKSKGWICFVLRTRESKKAPADSTGAPFQSKYPGATESVAFLSLPEPDPYCRQSRT